MFKKIAFILCSFLLLVSCSNYLNMANSNEDNSQMQSSLSGNNVQGESPESKTSDLNSQGINIENIIQSSDEKTCYNITKQINVDNYTVIGAKFVGNDNLIIIQMDANNPQNQRYLLTLYNTKKLEILKTLPIQMNAGSGYTSCSVGDNTIKALDINKGSLNLYDLFLNSIKEIKLPSGYSDYKIALSKDNKKLACVTNERKSLEVYNTDNSERMRALDRIQLPQFNSDFFCTGVAFMDDSRIVLNLQTQEHELCMAIYNIETDELNSIIDGNMNLSQTQEDYYLKNDITGSFSPLMRSKCDTFKIIIADGKQEAQYVPVPEQYNTAEVICFSSISNNKLIVDFNDDYSKINLSMLTPNDTVKYEIVLENRNDEFEPVNLQADNTFSEDGESIVLITAGKSIYLISQIT